MLPEVKASAIFFLTLDGNHTGVGAVERDLHMTHLEYQKDVGSYSLIFISSFTFIALNLYQQADSKAPQPKSVFKT